MPDASLPARDRIIVAMLIVFSLFNVTLDLYYVWDRRRMTPKAATDWAAWLWSLYAAADRFWIVAPWSLAQEGLNVFVTTLGNLWLIRAIVKRRPYRHALQLTLGSYLTYSVVLYFLAGHLSGYAGMREVTFPLIAFYYGVTLPWLLGHAYMAWDSYTAISRMGRAGMAREASPRSERPREVATLLETPRGPHA